MTGIFNYLNKKTRRALHSLQMRAFNITLLMVDFRPLLSTSING